MTKFFVPRGSVMKGWTAFGGLALVVGGWTAGVGAQPPDDEADKPTAPTVRVSRFTPFTAAYWSVARTGAGLMYPR